MALYSKEYQIHIVFLLLQDSFYGNEPKPYNLRLLTYAHCTLCDFQFALELNVYHSYETIIIRVHCTVRLLGQ